MALGVLLIQDNMEWPTKFWHWLWPVAVVGLVAVAISTASPRPKWFATRFAIFLVAASVSAWMLLPTWPNWTANRPVIGLAVAGYLSVLMIAFDMGTAWITRHDATSEVIRQLIIACAVTGFCLAASIAAASGLKYGELTATIAISLTGCIVAHGKRSGCDRALVILSPIVALMLGSAAFVGMIYPTQPVLNLLPLPFAPLAVVCAVRFFKSDSWRDIGMRYAVFAGVLVALTIFAVL